MKQKILIAILALMSLCGYAQLPTEGFETPWTSPAPDSPAAPPGWMVVDEDGPNVTWVHALGNAPDQPPFGGNGVAFLNRETLPPVAQDPKDWLISPAFTVPDAGKLKFQSRLTIEGDQGSMYYIMVSTDSNPANLDSYTAVYTATELQINPVQTSYNQVTVDLAQFGGQQVHIAFVMVGNNDDRWLIDDVEVYAECPSPSNLNAFMNGVTASLSWAENGEATSWEIEVMAAGATPTGTGFTVTSNNAVIVSALSNGTLFVPGGAYKYYVRSVCAAGTMSAWSGPHYFPDDCQAPTDVEMVSSDILSATYTWVSTGAASYDYWITPTNDLPTASTVPTGVVASNTVVIPMLEPGITYHFYVRSVCGAFYRSPWSGVGQNPQGNVIHGKVQYDSNENGICDDEDTGLPDTEVVISINDISYSAYTNQNGEYYLYGLEDGTYTMTLQVVSPLFTAIAPITEVVVFEEEIDEVILNICLDEPNAVNDLEVTIVPLFPARPGLPAGYNVVVKNAGTLPQEDVVLTLSFNDERITYTSSTLAGTTATGNNLSVAIGDMQPLTSVSGTLVFAVMQPPVNIGDENLLFEASLSAVVNDITPDNNQAVLNQVIVNSYDPNDITVHEGAKIYEEQADDYLTYTIRFQNMGTAEAIDIEVENTLDPLLDWDTFEPIASSHNYMVKRTDDKLEFVYKGINLPHEDADEPGSHGFVTYKIKPKAEYGLGDIVSNTAEIYFDFNEAIVTNTATTEVIELLSIGDKQIAVAKLYPNPVKDQLHVAVALGQLKSVVVTDVNGRQCLSSNAETVDTNSLGSGIYFVKVTTDAGSADYKIIKH